jgi:excisionase family DNA binding protein
VPAVRKVVVMRTEQPKSKTKFYTIEQIAECVNASTRSVRRWIEQKLLIAHRINGLVRISEADFAAFLAAQRDE